MRRVAVLALIAVLVGCACAQTERVVTPSFVAHKGTLRLVKVPAPDDATLLWRVMVERVSNSSVECSADDLALRVQVGSWLDTATTLNSSSTKMLFAGGNVTGEYPVAVTLTNSRCAAVDVRVAADFVKLSHSADTSSSITWEVYPGRNAQLSLTLSQLYVTTVRLFPTQGSVRCAVVPTVNGVATINGVEYAGHGFESADLYVHRMYNWDHSWPGPLVYVSFGVFGDGCPPTVNMTVEVVTYETGLGPATLPPFPTPPIPTLPPIPTPPPFTIPPIPTAEPTSDSSSSHFQWWIPGVAGGVAAAAVGGGVTLRRKKDESEDGTDGPSGATAQLTERRAQPVTGVPVKEAGAGGYGTGVNV